MEIVLDCFGCAAPSRKGTMVSTKSTGVGLKLFSIAQRDRYSNRQQDYRQRFHGLNIDLKFSNDHTACGVVP